MIRRERCQPPNPPVDHTRACATLQHVNNGDPVLKSSRTLSAPTPHLVQHKRACATCQQRPTATSSVDPVLNSSRTLSAPPNPPLLEHVQHVNNRNKLREPCLKVLQNVISTPNPTPAEHKRACQKVPFCIILPCTEDDYILIAVSGIMAVPKWDPSIPKYDDYLISHSWIIAVAHVQANPRPSNQLLNASYDNGNSLGLTLRNMVVNIPEKGANRQTASQMRHGV